MIPEQHEGRWLSRGPWWWTVALTELCAGALLGGWFVARSAVPDAARPWAMVLVFFLACAALPGVAEWVKESKGVMLPVKVAVVFWVLGLVITAALATMLGGWAT